MFKKIFIICVAVIVYFQFFPNPKVDAFIDEQITLLTTTLDQVFGTHAQVSPSKLKTELVAYKSNLTSSEWAVVEVLADSRENIKQYYQQYCEVNKRHPILQDRNADLVCNKIEVFKIK
ncbi:hypothetical protein [Thalassotalea aquiviva]|uniref:hypothetical protein n=1 Tax=Thalassotalea aquiviva TaxID=3242415 RepID=UPI00352AAFD3